MTVVVRVLGPLECELDGSRVDLGPPQQRALIALLALRSPEVVSVTTLVDCLWPDGPPASATNIVQTYVSRLRKALGDAVIVRQGAGYKLEQATVDAAQFEALLWAGELEAALTLWRGEALADLALLRDEGARLEELRLLAREQLLERKLAAGHADVVLAELKRLVDHYPLREHLVALQMSALYATGRQVEALAVYRAARTRLVDELGVEPGPELRDLEQRILAHDESLPRVLPKQQAHSRPMRRRSVLLVFAALVLTAAAVAAAGAFSRSGSAAPVVVPNSIVRIDPSTNRVAQVIPVGRKPSALIESNRVVWVANEGDRTLSRVDTRTGKVQTIGGSTDVGFLARDEHGNIYASGWDYPYVWWVDPQTGALSRRFRVRWHAVGMAVGGGTLWVVQRGPDLEGAISGVDLTHARASRFIRLGTNTVVATVAFGDVWVPAAVDDQVAVISPGSSKPEMITVDSKPYSITAGHGAIWVGCYGSSTVNRIDPESRRVTRRIDVSLHGSQSGIFSLAAGAGSVWVATAYGHRIVRIDPATNKIIATIPLAGEPHSITVDGDSIWVSVGRPGSI
jgi:DNA-binding SARP family transcriptional activator/streptogramin lyase